MPDRDPLPAVVEPAAIGGAMLWRCPECGRVLGTVGDGRLVVRHYRRVVVAPAAGAEQACHGCGATSKLPGKLPLAS